jgi:hypothetical protein
MQVSLALKHGAFISKATRMVYSSLALMANTISQVKPTTAFTVLASMLMLKQALIFITLTCAIGLICIYALAYWLCPCGYIATFGG